MRPRLRSTQTLPNDSIEGALANVRNKLTDGKSNPTDFRQSSVFAAMSQIWLNPLYNPDTATKPDCCGAFYVNSISWRTQVKSSFKQTGITLKRLVISRLYRQADRQQHADEARIQSPHIRHFGLKPRRRSVAGTSIH
jgi:hypothetical protein